MKKLVKEKYRIGLVLIILSLLLVFPGCIKHVPEVAPPGTRSAANAGDVYYAVMAANYYKYAGDFESAVKVYDDAIARAPDDAELYLSYIKSLIEFSYNARSPEAGRDFFNRAYDICRLALSKFPENVDIREIMVDLQVDSGKYSPAIENLKYLAGNDSGDCDHSLQLARLYLDTSQPEKTLTVISGLTPDCRRQKQFLKLQGMAYRRLKQFDAAEKNLREFLKTGADDAEAVFELAQTLKSMHRTADAIAFLKKAVSENQDSVEMRQFLAALLKDAERYAEAVDVLIPLTFNAVPSKDLEIDIGRLYLLQDKAEQAIPHLKTALQIDPSDALANFYYAVALADMKKWEEALNLLSPMISMDKPPVPVILLAESIQSDKGDLVSALRLLEKGIRAHPDEEQFYLRLSELYNKNNYADDAQSVLDRAMKALPGNINITLAYAFFLDQQGKWREGLALAEKLLSEHPENERICNFVGYTLADHNQDLQRAETLIRKALNAKPEDGAFLDSMGWVYFRMGQYKKALEYLNKAAAIYTKDPLILFHVYKTLVALKQYTRAEEVLKKVIELDPDNREYSMALEKLKKMQGAD